MKDKIISMLVDLLQLSKDQPKIVKIIVGIIIVLMLSLIYVSCTVTLSVQKNNNNSSISTESSTSATSSVDSTHVNFNNKLQ